MAYKNQESAFHLTPAGWSNRDIPLSSRIESWRLSVYQESSWSREQRSWSRLWHSAAWSEAERQKLPGGGAKVKLSWTPEHMHLVRESPRAATSEDKEEST